MQRKKHSSKRHDGTNYSISFFFFSVFEETAYLRHGNSITSFDENKEE
jgi:hypothetical protein